jgi:hypothetical protein
VRAARTTAGTPTPIPIFASVDSPSSGLSADGAFVAVAVCEGKFVVDVPVDVRTRVCNDVGIGLLYGTSVDDVVVSGSGPDSDDCKISVPSSFRYIPE